MLSLKKVVKRRKLKQVEDLTRICLSPNTRGGQKLIHSQPLWSMLCYSLQKEERVKRRDIWEGVGTIAAAATWLMSRIPVLTKDELECQDEIGVGEGGVVFTGFLRHGISQPKQVAIKQLPPGK